MEESQRAAHRSSSGKHVVWDEKNLEENEKIQAEFASVDVNEPKTPYHGPSAALDELEDDMRPLQLGDPDHKAFTAFDYVMSNGGADFQPGAASLEADADVRGRARSEASGMSSGKRSERSNSEARSFNSSEGSAGRGSGEKRQRFEAARRAHYNMKEALKLGRQLASASEDDTRDDEDGGRHGGEDDDEDELMRDCGSSRLQDGALTAGHPNGSAEAAGAEEEAAGEGAPGDKAQHKKKKKQQQNGLQRKGEGEQLGEEEH